jgi:hypothetical protein
MLSEETQQRNDGCEYDTCWEEVGVAYSIVVKFW